MKIKELIRLNETKLLQTYMKNQGITNLTDKEVDALYGVCEGHGYELFTTDLKNGQLCKVDECIAADDEFVLLDDPEDDYSYETPESFVDTMIDYLGELCNDSYENRDDLEEPGSDLWKSYFETFNELLDVRSKIRESYKKYKYTVEANMFVNDLGKLKRVKEVFNSEIDCYNSVYKLVKKFIDLPKMGELKDLNKRYDLSKESELDKFLLEIKDLSNISLLWDDSYLSINIREEVIPETYYISIDTVKYGVYDHESELLHFNSKIRAIKKFNEIVEPYKQKYPSDKLGEHDSVYEVNNDNTMSYELYLDDNLSFECTLGLVKYELD